MRHITDFLKDEKASAAIETGLLTSIIGVATVTALSDLGQQLAALFNYITSVIQNAMLSAGGR